jgi:hypothetical protein
VTHVSRLSTRRAERRRREQLVDGAFWLGTVFGGTLISLCVLLWNAIDGWVS